MWGDGSETGVLLLLLLLSKGVKVCRQLRAENSSVAKEVEALGVVWLGTSPSSSNVLVGVAGARVTCQWLKKNVLIIVSSLHPGKLLRDRIVKYHFVYEFETVSENSWTFYIPCCL